ncbi:GIY-YIG nuclease family protein [Flavobacterium frigidarium]|uniref:GIY-YIG nuclease family protein n=1 Tax=Flavobacterium frigidarium TaxID=99286 RepID=UPI0030DBF6D3|tara:strand:+ start:10188 stop:10682 length:495 start_codon:yes stop_codon:yes gene_type:complete
MKYHFENSDLYERLKQAEIDLFSSEKLKFKKDKNWREISIPDKPGVYALYEDNHKLLYIGETGNLRARMNEINRTVNHSFRKELGFTRFEGVKSKKKFDDNVELKLDTFFEENLYVSFIEVNFGRLEIETFIITNHQTLLLNSIKKRKLNIEISKMEMREKASH